MTITIISIVGNADNGKMMSEQEFEEFKNNVREARKNRLYVCWRNADGQDCRTIGPSSQCFCGHRFKDHFFDNVKERKIYCRTPKCSCKMFDYVPICKNKVMVNGCSWFTGSEVPVQAFLQGAQSVDQKVPETWLQELFNFH